MVSITADLMQAMLNVADADISNTNMEYLIDYAVNRLNTYGCEIPNMTGTAGSKTLEVESREAGAVQEITRIAYYACYKGQENISAGSLSVSVPNLLGNPVLEAQVEKLARNLVEFDVSTG